MPTWCNSVILLMYSLARHVSGTYAHHQEHRFWVETYGFLHRSFWIFGGLESRCVGRVYGADGAVHPSKNSVQKTICFNSTSNAPDDGEYVPETCRAKNISIKLTCCIKLAFRVISWGRCRFKQPSNTMYYYDVVGYSPSVVTSGALQV